jgi:hypothetical protein
MDWTTFPGAVSIISQELIMKTILKKMSAFMPPVEEPPTQP